MARNKQLRAGYSPARRVWCAGLLDETFAHELLTLMLRFEFVELGSCVGAAVLWLDARLDLEASPLLLALLSLR
jgi:hypothetical protein